MSDQGNYERDSFSAESVRRWRTSPQWVVDIILGMYRDGHSFYSITKGLNERGIPTARGARQWSFTTVKYLCLREARKAS